MSTPCGILGARQAAGQSSGVVEHRITDGSTSIGITDALTSASYSVTVTAVCSGRSRSGIPCLPLATMPEQMVSFVSKQSDPLPTVTQPPSPSSTNTAAVTPVPSSAPPAPAASGSAPSVAGPAVGAVVAILAVGGSGFFVWRNYGAVIMGYMQAPQVPGSFEGARGGLQAHPIFGASGGPSADADYAQLEA